MSNENYSPEMYNINEGYQPVKQSLKQSSNLLEKGFKPSGNLTPPDPSTLPSTGSSVSKPDGSNNKKS